MRVHPSSTVTGWGKRMYVGWSPAWSTTSYVVSVASLILSCGATLGLGRVVALVGSRLAAISLVLACAPCLS